MVCAKCNEVCANQKEMVKCSDCACEFHVLCSRIRTIAKFNRMTPQDIAAWRCDSCKQDSASSASSLPDNEEPTLLEVLKSIRLEIAKNNQESRDNFSALRRDVNSVNSTLNNLQTKLLAVEKENIALKSQCEQLKTSNTVLSNKVHSLQNEVEELQQYSRSNNVEIKGVPLTKDEDITTILQTAANALKVQYLEGDISIAHRLQQPKDRSVPPKIVVQFVSRTTRNEWLSAARKKHLQTTDLSRSFTPAPVYLNEHLTAANKAMLGKAKYLVKSSKLHAAWTRNGCIYVRKTEGSKALRVRSVSEVCSIAGVDPNWTAGSASANKR